MVYVKSTGTESPEGEYEGDPVLPFSLSFMSPNTVPNHLATRKENEPESPPYMLVCEP